MKTLVTALQEIVKLAIDFEMAGGMYAQASDTEQEFAALVHAINTCDDKVMAHAVADAICNQLSY